MGISDGSSDVCSADLFEQLDAGLGELQETHEEGQTDYLAKEQHLNDARQRVRELARAAQEAEFAGKSPRQIGRASGRERGCQYRKFSVVAGSLQKHK